MAYVAAHTEAGTRKAVNEDACCVEAAQTPLGEVLMAVVCDGVGGLAKGNLASSTVIDRFVTWFEQELPLLMEGMQAQGRFDFGLVQVVWGALLQGENELIRAYGTGQGARLGTTFTGIIACGDHYLMGHVGDCRAYRMTSDSFAQISEDQTLVAKKLAAGEITQDEADRMPHNVILQSVGTERVLKPVFAEGDVGADDLFVICCDGAYHRAGNDGIRQLFQGLNYRDEAALEEACRTLVQFDMDYGEKDNLTVVCFSGALEAEDGSVSPAMARPAVAASTPVTPLAPAYVPADDEEDEDMITAVFDEEDEPGSEVAPTEEDDLATMVDDGDEDDLATMVDVGGLDGEEDDLATMVDDEEDDLATRVDAGDEDDLATMVDAGGLDGDEDDLATMVDASDGDEDDLATMVDAGDDRFAFLDDDELDDEDDPLAGLGQDLLDFDEDDEDDEDEEEEDEENAAAWVEIPEGEYDATLVFDDQAASTEGAAPKGGDA